MTARKPTALKMLHGEQRTRIPMGEPVPSELPVEMPAELDADAQAVWQRLAPDLRARGVLTAWDADAFGTYCQAVSFMHQAQAQLNRDGLTVTGRQAQVVRHPAVLTFRAMSDLQLRVGARFGLTPSDRAGLAGEQRDDPMSGEHLLTGRYTPPVPPHR